MKKYITPSMEATDIKIEGMLCASGEDEGRQEGTFDEGYDTPL